MTCKHTYLSLIRLVTSSYNVVVLHLGENCSAFTLYLVSTHIYTFPVSIFAQLRTYILWSFLLPSTTWLDTVFAIADAVSTLSAYGSSCALFLTISPVDGRANPLQNADRAPLGAPRFPNQRTKDFHILSRPTTGSFNMDNKENDHTHASESSQSPTTAASQTHVSTRTTSTDMASTDAFIERYSTLRYGRSGEPCSSFVFSGDLTSSQVTFRKITKQLFHQHPFRLKIISYTSRPAA